MSTHDLNPYILSLVTFAPLAGALLLMLLPRRDRDIRDINDADLHAVVEEARQKSIPGIPARHGRPSPARAHKLHAALSQMFGWLLRRRRISANPTLALVAPVASLAD